MGLRRGFKRRLVVILDPVTPVEPKPSFKASEKQINYLLDLLRKREEEHRVTGADADRIRKEVEYYTFSHARKVINGLQ